MRNPLKPSKPSGCGSKPLRRGGLARRSPLRQATSRLVRPDGAPENGSAPPRDADRPDGAVRRRKGWLAIVRPASEYEAQFASAGALSEGGGQRDGGDACKVVGAVAEAQAKGAARQDPSELATTAPAAVAKTAAVKRLGVPSMVHWRSSLKLNSHQRTPATQSALVPLGGDRGPGRSWPDAAHVTRGYER